MQVEDLLQPMVDEAVTRALEAREELTGYLDVAGASRFLSLSPEAIRTLSKRRRIPRVTLPNGRVRFRPDELRAWAEGRAS